MIKKLRFAGTATVALTASALFGAQMDLARRTDGCVDAGGNRKIASSEPRSVEAQALMRLSPAATHEERIAVFNGLTEAWSKETDPCTRAAMDSALMKLGTQFLSAGMAARRGSYYPVPFVACVPSGPKKLSLSIAAKTASSGRVPVVHVAMRNVSAQELVVYRYRSPAEIFSATVLDALDRPAAIPADKQFLYLPASDRSKLPKLQLMGTHIPFPMALQPNEETWWDWDVSQDFDLSTPGAYRVSLGGPVNYLDTTVCSNTADLIVE